MKKVAPILALLMLIGGIPVLARAHTSGDGGSQLHADLARIASLLRSDLKPPSLRLARSLPADADGIGRLREPASTAQEQLGVALGELRQMNALTLDPHYTPALLAVGRAFVAVSGQDPLTRTAINPEYRGLGAELTTYAEHLSHSSDEAGELAGGVKGLNRQLLRAGRHARQLERALRQARPESAATMAAQR